jgi:hypothetical protein
VIGGQGVGDNHSGVTAGHGEPLVAECAHQRGQVVGQGVGGAHLDTGLSARDPRVFRDTHCRCVPEISVTFR